MAGEAPQPPKSARGGLRNATRASPQQLEPMLQPATPSVQRGAFEQGVEDFSKINSARHQRSRENTFNTPQLQSTQGRPEVKNDQKSMKELLDIFEMGVSRNISILRSELKEELKASTAEVCKDIMKCIEDTRGITMLEKLLRKIDQVMKGPVKVEFTEVYAEMKNTEVLFQDMVKGLEGQNSQNIEKVLLELRDVQKVQQEHHDKHDRAHQHSQEFRAALEAQLKEHMQSSEARHSAQLEQHQGALAELQRLHEVESEHHSKVDDAHARDAREKQELSEALRQAHMDITKIANVQETIHTNTTETAEIARQMRQEGTEHHKSLEEQISSQVQEVIAKVGGGSILRNAKQNAALKKEFGGVLEELGRIQQALQVEYFPPKRRTAFDDDGHVFNGILPHDEGGGHIAHIKRLRNFGCQTNQADSVECGIQTDKTKGDVKSSRETLKKGRSENQNPNRKKSVLPDINNSKKAPPPRIFTDQEALKEKARQAIIRPAYNVFNYYHANRFVSNIAMSPAFEYVTMGMILLNACWLGIDADYNPATVLIDSPAVFQIVEHTFCLFFSVELAVRFLAFRRIRYCLNDFWFVFDAVLVFFMVAETWGMTGVILIFGQGQANIGNAGLLRVLRIVKMLRVSRMARLMRSCPEILVLLKGIKAAFRSVLVFFGLWFIIIYCFALIFVTLSDGSLFEFRNVAAAMNTLLLDGILPQHGPIVKLVAAESPFFWLLMVSFIAIASVTLMNMLVGVLVEVVNLISSTEREGVEVMTLAEDLRDATQHLNVDWEDMPRDTFQLVLSDTKVAMAINAHGADPGAFVEAAQAQFEDLEKMEKSFGFGDFIELVLKMRGKNSAKVRDIKEQASVLKRAMNEATCNVIEEVSEGFTQLRVELRSVHEATMEHLVQVDDDDDGDVMSGAGSAFSSEIGSGATFRTNATVDFAV